MNDTAAPKSDTRTGVLDPKANLKILVQIVAVIAILIAGLWLYVRMKAGGRAADIVVGTMLQQPVELKNSIENVAANSIAWYPMVAPRAGTLKIDLSVIKGNEVDVWLVDPVQLENVKNKRQFTQFQDFAAQKTRMYARSARLAQGTYYLVLRDSTLGILSAKSTDIKMHARFEP